MLYRDFMQKYRPVYAAPDAATGATDGAAAAATEAAAATSPAATEGATAPVDTAAAPAVSDAAPAADAAKPDSAATLLEGATGKPKPETKPADGAEAAKPDAAADGKKDEPAPAEAKPDGDKKPEDKKADGDKKPDADAKTDPDAKDATAAEPPAPIKYEAFKLPDGIKLDDKELAKFTEFAGTKQIPQDVAQGLIDLYVAERQQDVVNARAEQRKTWDTLNDTWKTDLRNDPELGGNRLETTLSLAKAVVEEYLPANEQAEYMAHMRNNGMGNFKLHVKLLHNIGKAMNVFEDGIVPANAQAPKASKGPGQRGWYDNSLNRPS